MAEIKPKPDPDNAGVGIRLLPTRYFFTIYHEKIVLLCIPNAFHIRSECFTAFGTDGGQ